MSSSFTTALSALAAHSAAVSVVGNNLANISTSGYKASSVQFRDVVSQSIGSAEGSAEIGLGVAPVSTTRVYSQGAIQTSSRALDAAIQGDGFFVAKSTAGQTLYTRAGSFQVSSDGYLVTATGDRVQGFAGAEGGTVGDVKVPVGVPSAPKPTSNIALDLNLDAASAASATSSSPYTYSTSLQVYDSMGAARNLTLTFSTNGPGTGSNTSWTVTASVDGGKEIKIDNGTLSFDGNGQLVPKTAAQSGSAAVYDASLTISKQTLSGGATLGPLTWDIASNNTPRITQYSSSSAVSTATQDGSGPSEMTSVKIADGGKVTAEYANGEEVTVGQLAIALVANPETMAGVGDNYLQPTGRTSTVTLGLAGEGGRGSVTGGALEASTVDLASELTNLIIYQRGYQANSRVITTSDEMTQEALNLKR